MVLVALVAVHLLRASKFRIRNTVLMKWFKSGLNNPFAAMSYLTPVMAIMTLVFSLAIEPWHELSETAYFDTPRHTFESCALMLLGGALAFFMVQSSSLRFHLAREDVTEFFCTECGLF